MYFWRVEKLKAQLAVAPLTDREILPYAVGNGALYSLALAFPPDSPNGWNTVLGLMAVPMVILGTLWVYRENGGRAGRDFLQRFVAIGWVAVFRLIPAVVLVFLVLHVIRGAPLEPPQTSGLDALLGLGLSLAYYQRVGSHVRQVAGA